MADEDDVIDEIEEDGHELEEAEELDREDHDEEAGSEQITPAIEALASEIGWAPKDKWRGDPEDWKSAEDFLRGNVQASKALRETVKRQDTRLEEMNETIRRMATAAEKADQRAYDRAVADLKVKQREAVADGDTEAYELAEQEIAALEKDRPRNDDEQDNQQSDSSKNPDFIAFTRDHPWYGGAEDEDIEKTVYADQIAPAVARNYQGPAFYEKIADMVEKKFSKSPNLNRKGAPRVESGNGQMRRGNNGKKTFNDLPPEAKQACDSFVKQGLFKDREAYVVDYFEQEA